MFRRFLITIILIMVSSGLFGVVLGKVIYGAEEHNYHIILVKYEGLGGYEEAEEFKELDIPLSVEIQQYLKERCEELELDYYLILGLIQQESRFNVRAEGRNNNGTVDRGLMQLNSQYIDWFAEKAGVQPEPFNPYDNIDMGTWYFRHITDYWERQGLEGQELMSAVLGSYNRGIGGYRMYGGNRDYKRNILKFKEELENGI